MAYIFCKKYLPQDYTDHEICLDIDFFDQTVTLKYFK